MYNGRLVYYDLQAESSGWLFKSAVRVDLIVPPTRTVQFGPRSFAVTGPSTRNALPTSLRNDELSAMSFRRQLKTELYIRVYYSH